MSIEIPPWSGVPRSFAELWRMHKGDDVAVCAVWTHPDGAELRLTVNGEIQQTDATHHVFALSTVALAWKERWHWMKGWRAEGLSATYSARSAMTGSTRVARRVGT